MNSPNTEYKLVDMGIADDDRMQIVEGLSKLLADSYSLYLKTHHYHWNVTGQMFQSLHTLFEKQYQEQALAVDEVAERIRALGEYAPGSFAAFTKVSSIKEENGIPAADEMIYNLIQGNEAVVTTAREIIALADSCEDDVTSDLMIERMQEHEKNAWMLRSLITHQA